MATLLRSYVATNGYRYLYLGRRQQNGQHDWILDHRLEMERHIGRSLATNEHVHHINGNRLDNRIENLAVLHTSDHRRLEWHKASAQKRRQILGPAHAATERNGHRIWPAAARTIAVCGYKSGVAVAQIAKDFNVPKTRVYKWLYAAGIRPKELRA